MSSEPTPYDLDRIERATKRLAKYQHGDARDYEHALEPFNTDLDLVSHDKTVLAYEYIRTLPELAALEAENARLRELVHKIDLTLRCEAAEYVPAIGDVFDLIDAAALGIENKE